ncbi:MAG: hypothetical protein KDD35_01915 [Bdellovibrionales bacterium]|nr:hypothetical protein [Bdellovibrionales bacterium]
MRSQICFRCVLKLALFFSVVLGMHVAYADWSGLSVWEQLKFSTVRSHTGRVQAIAVNESDDEVIVRVAPPESNTLTFKVCSEEGRTKGGRDSEGLRRLRDEKMALLRQAMNKGLSVKVSTGSAFSECLSYIELIDDQI